MQLIKDKLIMSRSEAWLLKDQLILVNSLCKLTPDGTAEGAAGHEVAWGRKVVRIEIPEQMGEEKKDENKT